MKKTLYSLMLNDEVVREVDALAHRLGTNRSNLINEILAEYVNYTTPERRINDILSTIQELMQPSGDLIPFFAPHSYSLSLKSSLEYKYRPTIKYEVELYKGSGDTIGALSVLFRTQSPVLIDAMTDFFRLWKSIEDAHLAPRLSAKVDYALYDGKFVRTITVPDKNCSSDELASSLAEYIRLFDKMMKGWLTGRYDAHAIEAAYYSYLTNTSIHF
ncbi:MAG: ribbon-helix-helix protein, CopG family [Oscillospiraceae bacterium]|nr:ribbon-helix-helix protein, CopG family [Oscillospiraceae bacterium]